MRSRLSTARPSAAAVLLLVLASGRSAASDPSLIEMSEQEVRGQGPIRAKIVLLGVREPSRGEGQGWAAAEELIAAEFSSLGLHVAVERARSGRIDREALAEMALRASEHRALAALRVTRSGSHKVVELWLYDRLTGKSTLRRLDRRDGGRRGAERVALQAVEMVHASLLELELSEQPRSAELELDLPQLLRRLDRRTRPRGRRWQAWAGPSVSAVSFRHPAAYLALGAARRLGTRFRLGLQLAMPLFPFEVDQQGDTANVNLYRAGVIGRMELHRGRALSFGFGLTASALVVHSWATQTGPARRGRSDVRVTAHASIDARTTWQMSSALALFGEASLGGALPPVRVEFAGDTATRLDWTVALTSGLQLDW